MSNAFELLTKGYFPKELPPTFVTSEFANRTLGSIGSLPEHFSRSKRARLCTHNFGRVGRFRRVLGIPNPIPQFRLSTLIEKHWLRISRLFQMSPIGCSTPSSGRDRALIPGSIGINDARARTRATARHIIVADISRFYHSIYTHSLAWAVHGKRQSKRNRSMRLLGNRLDQAVSDTQDGQTIGIPVGPDTSLVLAEIVASAVDDRLRRRTRNLKGVRFMDDYELACATRREADELLDALHLALADFELAINPLKTTIQDLPLTIDQPWKAPIRSAALRASPVEQATDLIGLFDIAYGLSRQHPDKTVLAYAIGRVKDELIDDGNIALYQHLLLQCMLAEPGTAVLVLGRLSAIQSATGLVNVVELGTALNDQIAEHSRAGHANEVAWALWGALTFNILITRQAAQAVGRLEDSVVALLALHCRERGLIASSLDTSAWQSLLTAEQLYGEHWLLAYEASVKRWLRPSSGIDYVGSDANFNWLRSLGIEFYDVDQASPIVGGAATGAPPDWLSELEERAEERRTHYGDRDE